MHENMKRSYERSFQSSRNDEFGTSGRDFQTIMTAAESERKRGVGAGISWSLFSQLGRQLATFGTTVLLARFLSPEDFGLIGMATVFTGLVGIVNDVGVSGALVQRKNIEEVHLSSMFWLNICVGVVLFFLTYFLSDLISEFFSSDRLSDVLKVIGVAFVAGSLSIVQQSILLRGLDFKPLAVIETISVLLAGAVSVLAAFLGFGVWSIVFQLVLAPVFTSIGLWIRSSWRPAFVFDVDALGELVPYGLNMAAVNVVNYFSRNLDYIFVGKYLGAAALGYYTLAYRLMMYPLQAVSTAVARVAFPAFSRNADNLEALGSGYLRMVGGVSLFTFPMVVGVFSIAPEFVAVVFGAEWNETSKILRILCVAGLVQSVGTTVGSIYQAIGRPQFQLRMAILNSSLTAIVLFFAVSHGLEGVALAYSAFAVLWVHFSLFVVSRIVRFSYWKMYRQFGLGMFISLLMAASMFSIKPFLGASSMFSLSALIGTGGGVVVALMFCFGKVRVSGRRLKFNI